MLSWIFKLNKYIFYFLSVHHLFWNILTLNQSYFIYRRFLMDKYLTSFREMLSLRGLTDHTIASYSTYISAYLQYLSDNGPTAPEDASWQQMRDFIFWVQNTRNLSDRTINACISQLRFLHFMSSISPGTPISSLSENLTLIPLLSLHVKKWKHSCFPFLT